MILILAVLFALGIAFFATQNTSLVTLRLAGYTFSSIPLYIVMAISLLMGLFVAWLVGLVDSVTSLVSLRGKDTMIRQANAKIVSLEKKIQDLEVQNARLTGEEYHEEVIQPREEVQELPVERRRTPFFPSFGSLFR